LTKENRFRGIKNPGLEGDQGREGGGEKENFWGMIFF
jgi:hypothetical protein